MVIQNYRDIKSRAAKVLNYTPWDTKKTVLLFGLIPLGLSLILTIIDLLLSSLNTVGGIEGLQVYSMLSSVSSFLWMAVSIGQQFWAPGILYCGLMVLREQNPYPKGLLQGFRKWKTMLRYMLLLILLFIAVNVVLSMVVSMICVPFLPGLTEIAANMPETEAEMLSYMETVPEAELLQAVLPMLIVYCVLLLVLVIPFIYRARLAELLILDEQQIGARQALKFSFRLTKGSCMQLFRLDLSFWWYHLLIFLCGVIPYLELLPVFNSWNENVTLLVLTALQCAATLGVYMLGIMKVQTANAVAYDHLRTVPQTDLPQLPEETAHG